MNLLIIFIYFILGIILYVLNKTLIKKYNITKFKSIIISLLYIFILSGIFNYYVSFTENIFIVLVFYLVVDIINTTYFMNDDFFSNDKIKYYILLILLGFILNIYFINKVDNVFLDPEQLKLVIWVLIIIYLYKVIKNSKIYTLEFKDNQIDKESIGLSYVKYKNKYKLKYEDKDLELIIYGLMIFNNRNRNSLQRKIDKLLFNLGNNKKISIMQLDSKKIISDEESISIVYEKLSDIKKKNKKIESIIKKYDPDNYEEIISIVNMIKDYFN